MDMCAVKNQKTFAEVGGTMSCTLKHKNALHLEAS